MTGFTPIGKAAATSQKPIEGFPLEISLSLGKMSKNENIKLGTMDVFEHKGVNYVIGKTKSGMVFQTQSDWLSGKRSGLFMGTQGDFSVPATAKKEIEAMQGWLKHLGKLVDKTPGGQVPVGYVKGYTDGAHGSGQVIQKQENYYSKDYNLNNTGIFVSANGKNVIFDGDPQTLAFLKERELTPKALAKMPQAKPPEEKSAPSFTAKVADQASNKATAVFKKEKMAPPEAPKATAVSKIAFPNGSERKVELTKLQAIYRPGYLPTAENRVLLEKYVRSNEYEVDAKTAKGYYNKGEINPQDAQIVLDRREPTNINAELGYDPNKLKALKGYERGVYNDPSIKKTNGDSFTAAPNTVCVFSRTKMWPHKNQGERTVCCLSLPAPALDNPKQPHYQHFVQNGRLNQENYRKEMSFLAQTIVRSYKDNRNVFDGNSIQRIVIPRYGQSAFIRSLTPEDKEAAQEIFFGTLLEAFKESAGDLKDVQITFSEHTLRPEIGKVIRDKLIDKLPEPLKSKAQIVEGDILSAARTGDFIINPWDPHSIPGNGNAGDPTFDGAMGNGTGILNQYPGMNNHLRDPSNYVGV